jgi:hypothetical protein
VAKKIRYPSTLQADSRPLSELFPIIIIIIIYNVISLSIWSKNDFFSVNQEFFLLQHKCLMVDFHYEVEYFRLREPEDGGNAFFRNVGKYVLVCGS